MSKSIKTLAILSVVLEVAYIVFGRFVIPFAIFFFGQGSKWFPMTTKIGDEGVLLYSVMAFVTGFALIFLHAIYMILLMNAANGKSEKIAMEVSGIIICTVLPIVMSSIISLLLRYFINAFIGSAASMSQYSLMTTYASFLGFLQSISRIVLIISFSFSICRKKFVLPLEYEKGYGVEDEYGNVQSDLIY